MVRRLRRGVRPLKSTRQQVESEERKQAVGQLGSSYIGNSGMVSRSFLVCFTGEWVLLGQWGIALSQWGRKQLRHLVNDLWKCVAESGSDVQLHQWVKRGAEGQHGYLFHNGDVPGLALPFLLTWVDGLRSYGFTLLTSWDRDGGTSVSSRVGLGPKVVYQTAKQGSKQTPVRPGISPSLSVRK